MNGVEAWGYVGHKVVAGLAEKYLSSETWQWIHKIQDDSKATLTDICVQADEYGYSQYGGWSLPLHYVNSPFDAASFDVERDCGASVEYKCAVTAIVNYTTQLDKLVARDDVGQLLRQQLPPVPGAQRLADHQWVWHSVFDWEGPEPTPLAFLVHFFSDLGQPLHAGFSCDKGGNSVVTMQTWQPDGMVQMHNLHRIWDSTIIELHHNTWQPWVAELYAAVEEDPAYWWPLASNVSTAVELANWSYRLATGNAYWFDVSSDDPIVTDERNYPGLDVCPLELPYLTDDYFHHSMQIIRQQLIVTALRLATHLNAIFYRSPRS